MRKTFNNSTQPTSFKDRSFKGYKLLNNLRFGNSGIAFSKNYTIEKLHFVFFKKKLKLFLKSKRCLHIRTWFFLTPNYPIFKKGKNARMGKGKGIYQRLSFKTKKNQIFIEFFNLNLVFLKKIASALETNSNLKNSVVTKPTDYRLKMLDYNSSYYKIYKRF